MMAADVVQLRSLVAGAQLRLRVKPGGRRNRLGAPYGGALKVTVQAPPERGKANAAVIKLLAAQLAVARSAVEIVAGLSSQDKVAVIHGLAADELRRRLAELGVAAELTLGPSKGGTL